MPNIQPENNYFYYFGFVVNLGVVNNFYPIMARERVFVATHIPAPTYLFWRKEARKQGKTLSVVLHDLLKKHFEQSKPEPLAEEEQAEQLDAVLIKKGMGEHRRMIEAAAIRCTRAKRTAQNIDTQI